MIRVATRRSALALAQAGQVADAIASLSGEPVELVPVVSEGDQSSLPLAQMGGQGVFVAAVRECLLAGDADLAVHSLKDLPTQPHPGIHLLAVPPRGPVEDVIVTAHGALDQIPAGGLVGTGSPRRQAQVRLLRPDLRVIDIRGNVDTRLAKVGSRELAAVVLARAGMDRLGLAGRISEVLSPARMLPAPGQGALAVECTESGAADFDDWAADLDHPPTRAAVTAERSALASLEAGCSAPVAALALVDGEELVLEVAVLDPAGGQPVTATLRGPVAQTQELGREAAERLLDLGAGRFLGEAV